MREAKPLLPTGLHGMMLDYAQEQLYLHLNQGFAEGSGIKSDLQRRQSTFWLILAN